jgi:hypothetical protein
LPTVKVGTKDAAHLTGITAHNVMILSRFRPDTQGGKAMEENTRKARELITEAYNLRNSLRFWTGTDYGRIRAGVWSMADNPVGGDTVSMDNFGLQRHSFDSDAEGAEYIALDFTLWGDYIGSVYARSNERSLLRDYPDTFIQATGYPGAYELYLPADADIDEHLFAELVSLADQYPVYDESDESELEMELADEAWDDYLEWDIPSDLEKTHSIDRELIDENMERIKTRFYELTGDADEYPYAESAISVVFPKYDETLTTIAQELQAIERQSLA